MLLHPHNHSTQHDGSVFETFGMFLPFLFFVLIYITAVHYSNRKYNPWPFHRTVSWVIGVACIAGALIGPLAEQAHSDFNAHMYTHLLLGMLGPLLLALSAPMTLLLRMLQVKHARKITRLLKSTPLKIISHPFTATFLNMGGLWLLYTTSLFTFMHTSIILYVFVHLHVFIAGYLFTISMIYIDPTPHRTSFKIRAIVLIFAMASHSILSKWIYAQPPPGVARADAEQGGLTMYYGGDAIDLIIVVLLCYQLYKIKSPRKEEHKVIEV